MKRRSFIPMPVGSWIDTVNLSPLSAAGRLTETQADAFINFVTRSSILLDEKHIRVTCMRCSESIPNGTEHGCATLRA